MQFVICDDNAENLKELEKLFLRYSSKYQNLSFGLDKFSDAALLLHKIRHEKPADIYILDIVMSWISGIDLGREIRKRSRESMIIYITVSEDFALEAYDVLAIRYLVKPVDENRFFEALDYALAHMQAKNNSVFPVKTKNGLESVPYHEIAYIENSSRKLDVHLTDGSSITSIYIRRSFEEEIKELLQGGNFLCVHKSFLVNLNHVRKLNQSNIIMTDGTSIPVSRKNSFQVKKDYLLFISNQYHRGDKTSCMI